MAFLTSEGWGGRLSLDSGWRVLDPLAQVFGKKKKWKIKTSWEGLVINGRKVALKSRFLQHRSRCIHTSLSGPPLWRAKPRCLMRACVSVLSQSQLTTHYPDRQSPGSRYVHSCSERVGIGIWCKKPLPVGLFGATQYHTSGRLRKL